MTDKLTTVRIQRIKESDVLRLRAVANELGYKSENDLLRDMIQQVITPQDENLRLENERQHLNILKGLSDIKAALEIMNFKLDEENR